MDQAKIRLSQTEMEMATSAELILTKNAILQKVNELLAALQQQQLVSLAPLASRLPEELARSSPKISRGENYKGLPYYMLDHPRIFSPDQVFAIRTMFWWGHFFSTTLHLSGKYKEAAAEKLLCSLPSLRAQGFFIGVNEEQWEHHFGTSNYVALADISDEEIRVLLQKHSFLKLANKIPLQQWDEAPALLLSFFDQLLAIVID